MHEGVKVETFECNLTVRKILDSIAFLFSKIQDIVSLIISNFVAISLLSHGGLTSMQNPATILRLKAWQNCHRTPRIGKKCLKHIFSSL